ncbi:hypothetical protein FQN57_001866 [Myotisia sp. PD_48]|nr:hypothetical protein FQN57_001866 [Myotisia sp. PD_48]
MVVLRLAIKVASPVVPDESSPKRTRNAPTTLANTSTDFLMVLREPEKTKLGHLARIIKSKWAELRADAEPLQIKRMLNKAYDTCELSPELTAEDVFVDIGQAAREGHDQHGILIVIPQPTVSNIRYGSVVQDWNTAAEAYPDSLNFVGVEAPVNGTSSHPSSSHPRVEVVIVNDAQHGKAMESSVSNIAAPTIPVISIESGDDQENPSTSQASASGKLHTDAPTAHARRPTIAKGPGVTIANPKALKRQKVTVQSADDVDSSNPTPPEVSPLVQQTTAPKVPNPARSRSLKNPSNTDFLMKPWKETSGETAAKEPTTFLQTESSSRKRKISAAITVDSDSSAPHRQTQGESTLYPEIAHSGNEPLTGKPTGKSSQYVQTRLSSMVASTQGEKTELVAPIDPLEEKVFTEKDTKDETLLAIYILAMERRIARAREALPSQPHLLAMDRVLHNLYALQEVYHTATAAAKRNIRKRIMRAADHVKKVPGPITYAPLPDPPATARLAVGSPELGDLESWENSPTQMEEPATQGTEDGQKTIGESGNNNTKSSPQSSSASSSRSPSSSPSPTSPPRSPSSYVPSGQKPARATRRQSDAAPQQPDAVTKSSPTKGQDGQNSTRITRRQSDAARQQPEQPDAITKSSPTNAQDGQTAPRVTRRQSDAARQQPDANTKSSASKYKKGPPFFRSQTESESDANGSDTSTGSDRAHDAPVSKGKRSSGAHKLLPNARFRLPKRKEPASSPVANKKARLEELPSLSSEQPASLNAWRGPGTLTPQRGRTKSLASSQGQSGLKNMAKTKGSLWKY